MTKILIIEDNRTILENTAEYLALVGYKTITATNGKNGLEKIYQFVPDLILCDLLMPEMDGLEVLRTLESHPDYRTIPFLFFSAKTEKKDIKKGLDAGALDYIVKPFDFDELVQKIEVYLKKRKNPKII